MKRGLAAVALAVMVTHLLFQAGLQEGLAARFRDALEDGSLLSASLSLELGAPAPAADTAASEPPELTEKAVPVAAPEAELPALPRFTAFPGPGDKEEKPPPEETEPGDIRTTTIAGGLKITNDTGYEVDIAALLAEELTQTLPADSPQILIIHTHGTEAYERDIGDDYEASDSGRTQDKDYNVVRVGDELAAALTARGLVVLHDRGIYDYPSYTGSYARSGAAIQSYLSEYPDLALVIDLHRDALGAGGVVYKTMAEGAGLATAQLMLLVGTGENGLEHPAWRENLKLALAMQNAMAKRHPTLARPVALKPERYNQHLTTGSLILEVGSSGNTLTEALNAVRLFADAAAPVLLDLIEASS